MIAAGRTLQQRYRIDKQIGQGGMGAVYVATDERFGSTVAIKETLCMDDNFRKAIEREARLLNSLKHTALPRVSDHFEEENSQFLVMEYIAGEDLCCVMDERHRTFDVEDILKWADQLLDALDYLHNQDIPVVHRDIKPQNLKLTPRGQIVLLDFGLAKGNPTDAAHQTAAKSIFGYSRSYASLEQIQGTGTDPRSDLYSLAATLYHLLTGVAPEDALTRAMAVLSQKPDPLVPANLVRPGIPAGVAGVLQKAMDLNADGRPSSAAEMRQMFRESEKYAYLAEHATSPAINMPATVPQPTGFVAGETRPASVSQTDVKTEVLPLGLSEVTSIRPGTAAAAVAATSVQSYAPRRRGPAVAIGAAALVLLGVFGAAALYVAKPSLFGAPSQTAEQPAQNVPMQPVANTNSAPANTETGAVAGGGATENTANTETAKSAEQTKPVETTKNSKPTGTGKMQNNQGGDLQVTDPDVPGDVTMTDRTGRTITVRPAPIPPEMRGQPPAGGDPFPFDPNKFPQMTPAQRKKIQQAIKDAQRQQQREQLQVYRPQN